jgi:hypothetical protein
MTDDGFRFGAEEFAELQILLLLAALTSSSVSVPWHKGLVAPTIGVIPLLDTHRVGLRA